MTTIPAQAIVAVEPSVLAAGGRALDAIALMLTENTQVPIDAVQAFSNASDVASYFGASSDEYAAALIYFSGFDGAHILPGSVLFAQYPSAAVAAYLRGAGLGSMTLAQLKASSTDDILKITVGGVEQTSGAINLSAATSFSDAASIIETAFTTPPFSVSYDSIANAFKFTSTATGAAATIGYASGDTGDTLHTTLKLTAATGAVLSQGADATTPSAFMANVTITNRNWATFMTIFDPDTSGHDNKLAFASWCGLQDDRYAYVCWDTDATPKTTVPATASLGYDIAQAAISGTLLISADDYTLAAFACGWAASLDYTQYNGRATLAFKGQSSLTPTVTDQTTGDNLMANGYNFYGSYATAKQQWIWFYPGSISGEFLWADSYINQIQLNADLQRAGMNLFANTKSIPYTQAGYDLIRSALRDPINAALNFGSIRSGVTLSEFQKQAVNNGAGLEIDNVLSTVGWYLQVSPASAETRAVRGSPPITLWYMDGQSVQKLQLESIEIQ